MVHQSGLFFTLPFALLGTIKKLAKRANQMPMKFFTLLCLMIPFMGVGQSASSVHLLSDVELISEAQGAEERASATISLSNPRCRETLSRGLQNHRQRYHNTSLPQANLALKENTSF
jgi:hypothetical protein